MLLSGPDWSKANKEGHIEVRLGSQTGTVASLPSFVHEVPDEADSFLRTLTGGIEFDVVTVPRFVLSRENLIPSQGY